MSRTEAPVRVEVHYEDQTSTIELNQDEVDAWIADKAAFAGHSVEDFYTFADVIAGHIALNLNAEGITL